MTIAPQVCAAAIYAGSAGELDRSGLMWSIAAPNRLLAVALRRVAPRLSTDQFCLTLLAP